MEDRARQRELRNAGVVAAREARQKLASAIEMLDGDASDAPALRLAGELSGAVGSLFGCEIGDAPAVLDKLRAASAVLSGVLARLHGPAGGTRTDEAGELVAASLAILYPVRAGLERDLVAQRAAAEAAPASRPAPTGSDRPRTLTVRGNSVRVREVAPELEVPVAQLSPEAEAVRVLASQASPTLIDPSPPVHVEQAHADEASASRGPIHVDDAGVPRRPISVRPVPIVDPRAHPTIGALLQMGAVPDASPSASPPPRTSLEAQALFPDATDDALPPLLLLEKRGAHRARRRALELVTDARGELVDVASGEVRPSGVERRVQERVELEVDIGLHSATQFYAGLTNDISEGGIFVSTIKPMPVGSELTISFVLPGGHAVTTRGRVAWLSSPRDEDSRPGMGVRFVRLEPEHREAIERFLRYRPAMLHEL